MKKSIIIRVNIYKGLLIGYMDRILNNNKKVMASKAHNLVLKEIPCLLVRIKIRKVQ